MDPIFLSLADIIAIHKDQIDRYGGAPEIRDLGLLESALAQPRSGFGDEYLHSTIYEMAAAYLFHISQNHPFVDGNKRVAAMSMYTFLDLNGIELDMAERDFERFVWEVAEGNLDKPSIAKIIETHCQRE